MVLNMYFVLPENCRFTHQMPCLPAGGFVLPADTNFINFAIQNKLEICKAMMDCLFAKCIPCITDCVRPCHAHTLARIRILVLLLLPLTFWLTCISSRACPWRDLRDS